MSSSSESSDRGTRRKQRARITARKPRRPDRTFALPVPASVEDFVSRNHGTHVPDLTYDNERNTTLFGYIYLMKKYHSKCFVPGQLRYKAGKLKYVVQGNIYKKARVLGADLLNCAGPVFIPLEIRFSTDNVAHANLLIYRPSQGLVERFEPTFTDYAEYERVNAQLKALFEETLEPYTRFVSAQPQCPLGLQEVEEEGSPLKDEEGIGYCQMWCFFVMEAILMNPEMETAAIVRECFRVSESNPRYLRRLMQGYTFNFSKEMEAAIQLNIKKKGINKFVMTQAEKDRVYLEAFETAAYHQTERTSTNSTPRSSSEGDPDLKHTPLRDLEALLQFTRGNYDIFERPVRPTKQRKEYVRKINQFMDLHKMGMDDLWRFAREGWDKTENYVLNLDDPFHHRTKFIIPELKYAGLRSMSELHAYTQGHYDLSNIVVDKNRQQYSDAIQDYLDKNQMILSELWDAAEEKWGRTSVSA